MLARIFLLILLGFKFGCSNQEKAKPQANAPIARVHGQYLYQQDLENIEAAMSNPQDTVGLLERYVQGWIAKQLLIAEAEKEQGEDQKADIERKLLNYKYALIVHRFVEKQVNAKLDKTVTEKEISAYYQEYQENFRLKYPVVKGKFLVIPKDAPNQSSLKKLMLSKQEADIATLKSYCCQFAKDYSLDDAIWLNWQEIITKTPFKQVRDKKRFLKKTDFTAIQDDGYTYYLKIDAYKVVGEIAPIALVRDQILDVILYKRKLELANQIKEDILQQAKANKDYIIYDY